ncbi:hypothetical protein U9R90_25380 [Streptomyces sp. E11-3]|uniref:hypothetical protein n=1 Tax=Streptomyces sp. E11-3 TaxID=3110112 RepID=UPI00397EC14A
MAKQKHRKQGGDQHRAAQQAQRAAEQAQRSTEQAGKAAPSEAPARPSPGDFGEHSKKSKKFGHN